MFTRHPTPQELSLLVRVGRMYYEQEMTQNEIARATRLSRPTISRLLERARRAGIVEIRVRDTAGDTESLAAALAKRYGLRRAILAAPGYPGEDPRPRVGRLVAEYVQGLLHDGMTLGMSWGKTLREMLLALKPAGLAQLTVVQMMGGLAAVEDSLDTTGLAQEVGRVLGGRAVRLLAPALIDSPSVRRRVLSTREVQQAMEFLGRLDVAVLGIGAVSSHVPLVERGYFSAEAMAECRARGARGEMLLQFFDGAGRPLLPLNRRVVGMALQDLARVPLVVAGVSGPPDKSEAVLAALRGHLVHVLITDFETARRVLERGQAEAVLSEKPGSRPRRRP
jgi:DNA-binding transcriptional regulator LsrR (DeoR family)